jgi:hypothetical protein
MPRSNDSKLLSEIVRVQDTAIVNVILLFRFSTDQSVLTNSGTSFRQANSRSVFRNICAERVMPFGLNSRRVLSEAFRVTVESIVSFPPQLRWV